MSDERPTKIFISHAHLDKPLVDSLLNNILDLGCQIPRENIFCSSSDGTGVPYGEEWIADIKANLIKAELVIFVLSPNLYASQVCLNELGAAWILDKNLFPMVVPDDPKGAFNYPEGILKVTISDSMKSSKNLERLRDKALKVCGLEHKDSDNWENHKIAYLDSFEQIREQLPQPKQISEDELLELKQRASVYKWRWEEANKKLKKQEETIKKLLETDPDDRHSEWFDSLDDTQKFDTLLDELKSAIRSLPSPVDEALFRKADGKEYVSRRNDAKRAAEDGYLHSFEDGNWYEVNTNDPYVRKAVDALNLFQEFMAGSSTEFDKGFEKEHDMAFELNRRFWNKFISNIG